MHVCAGKVLAQAWTKSGFLRTWKMSCFSRGQKRLSLPQHLPAAVLLGSCMEPPALSCTKGSCKSLTIFEANHC